MRTVKCNSTQPVFISVVQQRLDCRRELRVFAWNDSSANSVEHIHVSLGACSSSLSMLVEGYFFSLENPLFR